MKQECRSGFILKRAGFLGLAVFFTVQPLTLTAQTLLDPETTAVRFVFGREVGQKSREWIQEHVFDEWFDGSIPKICHICDNVYRYPLDNGSIVTRGLRNLINRTKLSEIMEVREFLTVLVRRVGGEFHAEYFRYDLSSEEPVSTRVEELSEPWF